MFQRHNLTLVFDDLQISVDQERGVQIHLFEESLLVVEKHLVFGDLGLHSDFEVGEFVVVDGALLLVHDLLDLAVEVLNLVFLRLDLLDEVVNLLQASIRIGVLDAFAEVVLVLLVQVVPLLLLLREGRFQHVALHLGLVQVLLQVGDLFLVVARVVEGLNALANIDLAL